jgi:hypothetical protein
MTLTIARVSAQQLISPLRSLMFSRILALLFSRISRHTTSQDSHAGLSQAHSSHAGNFDRRREKKPWSDNSKKDCPPSTP